MKVLLLLFLVGYVTASFHDDLLDKVLDQAIEDVLEMEQYHSDDDDIKTELGKNLKKQLDDILEKMKEALEKGKDLKEDYIKKFKEIKDKLHDLHIEIGDKGKELLQKVRDRVKELWDKFLDMWGKKEKRSLEPARLDMNIRDIFQKLKKAILSKIDKEALKDKIHELFGKGNELAESLLEQLKTKGEEGKQKILDFIDRFFEEHLEKERRSLQELWEKVKDYFKNLQIDLKEKYVKFGEWVKNHLQDKLDAAKGKIENIKEIAKEFVEHTKGVSKDVATEALEFLRPYKEDLGSLWDQVKESVKDIINKKD